MTSKPVFEIILRHSQYCKTTNRPNHASLGLDHHKTQKSSLSNIFTNIFLYELKCDKIR